MCTICDKAKALPLDQALIVVQKAMKGNLTPQQAEHLDKLLGVLIGMPEPKVNRDAEGAWESRRRGR